MFSTRRRRFLIALAGTGGALAVGLVPRLYWWVGRRLLIRAHLATRPSNRLRNADFSLCTNPGVPDYWGTDATAKAGDPAGVLTVADEAPIRGVRSLRVHNAETAVAVTVHAQKTFVPDPVPYTLSAYFRTDGEDRRVKLRLGWGPEHEVVVGRQWNRAHITYEPREESQMTYGLQTRIYVDGPGTVWIAAPQLESGSAPTAFATALIDDRPLPELPWGGDEEWTPEVAGNASLLTAIAIENPTRDQLRDVAAHGFDAVAVFFRRKDADGPEQAARLRSLVDEPAACGLRVVMFYDDRESESWSQRTSELVGAVHLLKDHPALAAWIILDEPSRKWSPVPWNEIAALLAAAKNEDPRHPMIVNDNRWSGNPERLAATDVGSADIYPVGAYTNGLKPFADLSLKVNRGSAAAGKPAAMWLQLYGYNDAAREPTVEEERAMTYATFIHGSRFIFYYLYKPMSGDLWDSMKTMRDELRGLEAIVNAPGARCVRAGIRRGRVHFALWTAGARTYLIACNVAPDSVFVRFDLSGIADAGHAHARHGEGSSLGYGSSLWARFQAYERQVWEFAA